MLGRITKQAPSMGRADFSTSLRTPELLARVRQQSRSRPNEALINNGTHRVSFAVDLLRLSVIAMDLGMIITARTAGDD